jgi:hypothetical protein
MNGPCLRVLPAPELGQRVPGRFAPASPYAEDVWLPVLGPAAFLLWRRLAGLLLRHPEGGSLAAEELAAALGLGSPTGSQSHLARALRRLERFGVARLASDELVLVRPSLPFVSDHQLARQHPAIQRLHQRHHDTLLGAMRS